jgi:DNA repair protein RecO (recombination protein O)
LIRRRDEAFVLHTRDLGEADRIVTLLTERHGKVRAVAAAARRSRRRFGGCLEPMTRVSASWSEREGRELHRLGELEGVRSYAEMQADPSIQAACAVLGEVADALSSEAQADPQQFRLVGAVLDALERGEPAELLLRYFEYWTLRIHGLLPDLERCARCGASLPDSRPAWVQPGVGLLCGRCPRDPTQGRLALRGPDRAFLSAVGRRPPTAVAEAGRGLRSGAALEALLRGTLEAFVERRFRTYRHFRAGQLPTRRGGRR